MPEKYDKLFEAGNAAQLERLKANEHKTGWNDIDIDYALHRVGNNLKLARIMTRCDYSNSTVDEIKVIRRDIADIANYAHMIILKCDRLLKEEKSHEKA